MVLLRGYMQILKLSSSENAKNYEDKVENLKYHRKYNQKTMRINVKNEKIIVHKGVKLRG